MREEEAPFCVDEEEMASLSGRKRGGGRTGGTDLSIEWSILPAAVAAGDGEPGGAEEEEIGISFPTMSCRSLTCPSQGDVEEWDREALSEREKGR